MRKCISMILLLAMMLSLAVVGTVGTSAAELGARYACYASTEPTIDGEIDEIWSTTPIYTFSTSNTSSVKVLWTENAVYILADMNTDLSVKFFVSTRFHFDQASTWSSGGSYALTCDKTTDSDSSDFKATKPWFFPADFVATDATVKAKAKDNVGYVVEVKIPFRLSTDYKQVDSTIGFGAYVDGYYDQFGIKTYITPSANNGLEKSPYALADMKIHKPTYTQTEAPTCTTTGTKSATCSGCAVAMPSLTVPELGHDYAETATVDVEPTLNAKGSQSHHCSRCDATENASEIDETTIRYVGAQASDVTNGTYNVRFVAQIADRLNDFKAAGFKVSIVSASGLKDAEDAPVETFVDQTLTSSVAYTSIDAEGEVVEADSAVGGKYLIAIPITGIPTDASITFKITPVTVSTDGTVVEATGTNSYTVTLNNGEVVK